MICTLSCIHTYKRSPHLCITWASSNNLHYNVDSTNSCYETEMRRNMPTIIYVSILTCRRAPSCKCRLCSSVPESSADSKKNANDCIHLYTHVPDGSVDSNIMPTNICIFLHVPDKRVTELPKKPSLLLYFKRDDLS